VLNGKDAQDCDRRMYKDLFALMLDSGVYMPPAALEVNFLSTMHKPAIQKLSEAFDRNLRLIP
ncbi:MAG: aspartate aminotransferase family protein, partial [Methanomassiliicoccaceae archaeon]|nr:aspartate aminotransferase family protein [Methanomassiliicoccaceae archaeon]